MMRKLRESCAVRFKTALLSFLLFFSSSQGVSPFSLGYFLQKNKLSLAPFSYLSFKFSLQMLSWAERPQLSSPQTIQDTAQLSWTWLNENL